MHPVSNQNINEIISKNQMQSDNYGLGLEKNKHIYCYGDVPFFLKYDIAKNFWAAIKYDP